MWLAVGAGVVVFAVLAVVVGLVVARGSARPPVADGEVCVACGSSELVHPFPGVYICGCGYEGGPGMADFQWHQRAERIAAMEPAARQQLLGKSLDHAGTMLHTAWGELDAAQEHAIAADEIGTALTDADKRERARHLESVASLVNQSVQHQMESVKDLETARHIALGEGRMAHWYEVLTDIDPDVSGAGPRRALSEAREAQQALQSLLDEVHTAP